MKTAQPPPQDYIDKQKLVSEHANEAREDASNRRHVEAWLENRFAAQFHLRRFRGAKAHELIADLSKFLDGQFSTRIIDHSRVYSALGLAQVVITQPYGRFEEDDERKLSAIGIEVVDLDNWAFYYPPRATCYAIVMSPESRKALRLAANGFDQWAAHIFAPDKPMKARLEALDAVTA